jgi:hypothetical protein
MSSAPDGAGERPAENSNPGRSPSSHPTRHARSTARTRHRRRDAADHLIPRAPPDHKTLRPELEEMRKGY